MSDGYTFTFACPACGQEHEIEVIGSFFKPTHCQRCDEPFDRGSLIEALEDAEDSD